GQLGPGEDDRWQAGVVDPSYLRDSVIGQGVERGGPTASGGDVDVLGSPRDVTRGVDAGIGGALGLVDHDKAPLVHVHTGRSQVQACDTVQASGDHQYSRAAHLLSRVLGLN